MRLGRSGRRTWVALLLVILVSASAAGVALAAAGLAGAPSRGGPSSRSGGEPPAVEVHPSDPGVITALGQEGESQAGTALGGSGGSGSSSSFDLTPGRLCLAALALATNASLAQVAANPVNLQTCGFAVTPTAGAPAATTPAAALLAWQHDVNLPAPVPMVRPGWAIVGQLAYLQLGGARTVHWEGTALGLPVVIDASSRYDVDWGDGTVATGLSGPGGPWPGGDISHAYQRAGVYTISVVQRWQAGWRAGAAAGTIPVGLFTSGTLSLPAREVQATRDQ